MKYLLVMWSTCAHLQADGIDPVRIADEFKRAAQHAPTRPHILAPDK
jgi:hypothetical protein